MSPMRGGSALLQAVRAIRAVHAFPVPETNTRPDFAQGREQSVRVVQAARDRGARLRAVQWQRPWNPRVERTAAEEPHRRTRHLRQPVQKAKLSRTLSIRVAHASACSVETLLDTRLRQNRRRHECRRRTLKACATN